MSTDPSGSGRILDAALRRFAERGYENTTLDAVGDAAGVDRPSLELLFGTKAALFASLVDRELERLRRQVVDAIPTDAGDATAGRAVAHALDGLLDRMRADAPSWRLLLQADFGSFGGRHARTELRAVLRDRLSRLVASAAPLDPPDRRAVAELLATMLAATVEVGLDPLLAGDRLLAPGTVEHALDRLLATA